MPSIQCACEYKHLSISHALTGFCPLNLRGYWIVRVPLLFEYQRTGLIHHILAPFVILFSSVPSHPSDRCTFAGFVTNRSTYNRRHTPHKCISTKQSLKFFLSFLLSTPCSRFLYRRPRQRLLRFRRHQAGPARRHLRPICRRRTGRCLCTIR